MASAHQTVEAARIAAKLAGLPRGERQATAQVEADLLGISLPTLYRWMRPFLGQRKRRADSGALTLRQADAQRLAQVLTAGARMNGKQVMSVKHAVDILRRDRADFAGELDEETGEVRYLSLSAIRRGLRAYQMDAERLNRPPVHRTKRTLYPNHEWQVDASVCLLYFLPAPGEGEGGELADPARHYKNKPEEWAKVARRRVIRYVVTDHCSGSVRWRYYPHAESGVHTVDFLCWAMARPTGEPFRGVPEQLVVDPGATASGLVARFCQRMGIRLITTVPHNPRAKGSVEQAQNLIECGFESKFALHPPRSFSVLNALAEEHARLLNNDATHRRHGMTRYGAWQTIPPEVLRIPEPYATLRTLMAAEPATPVVRGDLTIAYRGSTWRVDQVPGVTIGERLAVHYSPYPADEAQGRAVATVEHAGARREVHLPKVERDRYGFDAAAPISGEEYARLPDTQLDTLRKRLALSASGSETATEDAAKRRAKGFVALGHLNDGRGLDPYKAAREYEAPTWLPKRGTPHRVATPEVVPLTLDHVEAAQRLAKAVRAAGGDWGPERYQWLVARYPQGVPETALAELVAECRSGFSPTAREGAA